MRPYVSAFGTWLLVLSASHAQANPLPPFDPAADPLVDPEHAFLLANETGGIPQNGVLLFEGPYNTPLIVSVHASSTGTALQGELSAIEDSRFWIWRPAQPLPLGSASAEAGNAENSVAPTLNTFEVVPAIVLGLPELTFAPSASLISVISSKSCCRARLGTRAMLVDTMQCVGVEAQSSIQVDPGVFTSTGQVQTNQYVFRFSVGTDERSTFTSGSFRSAVLPVFREQAQEYCFTVSAIELPTLRELTYDEPTACAAHGDLEALGTRALEPSAAELSRALCPAPPPGFEEAWCDVNEDCSADEASCELYPHVCEGEPLEPLSPTTVPEGGGDRDGGEDEDGAAAGAPMKSGSGGGCSVALQPSAAPHAARIGWLGALIALARLGRRRE